MRPIRELFDESVIPGYFGTVLDPSDLGTVSIKLRCGFFNGKVELLVEDFERIWLNCIKFVSFVLLPPAPKRAHQAGAGAEAGTRDTHTRASASLAATATPALRGLFLACEKRRSLVRSCSAAMRACWGAERRGVRLRRSGRAHAGGVAQEVQHAGRHGEARTGAGHCCFQPATRGEEAGDGGD